MEKSILEKIMLAAKNVEQDPAHDFSHFVRVSKNAQEIAKIEGGDLDVLIAAAYLHDIGNLPKNHPEAKFSSERSMQIAETLLRSLSFAENKISLVKDAILCHSFSRGLQPNTLEGKVFQDADRLDALGVIGVFRTIAISGRIGRGLYHPEDPFYRAHRDLDDKSWGLDHFYKKLYLLPNMMQTHTGRQLAQKRVEIMRDILKNFENEIL